MPPDSAFTRKRTTKQRARFNLGIMRGWERTKFCDGTWQYNHPNKRAWFIRRWPSGGWAVWTGTQAVTWERTLDLCKIFIQAQPLWLQCNPPPEAGWHD